MARRWIFCIVSIVLGLGFTRSVWADAVLFAGPVDVPTGGSARCQALNVGKKTLPEVKVIIIKSSNLTFIETTHVNLASASSNVNPRAAMSTSLGSDGNCWCRITVTGGGKRSVQGSLSVLDSDGKTILFVEAK